MTVLALTAPAPLPRTLICARGLDGTAIDQTKQDQTAQRFGTAQILRRQVSKRELRHLEEISAAVGELGRLPDRDESIHALMRGNFHGWDLVPAILQLAAPAVIDELCVATLGFNTRNARELLRLFDEGRILSVAFLCSHYFQKASGAEFEILRAGLVERGQAVFATRTHAKVIAARLSDGRCIVVEMSANLRSCHNIEQYAMTESPDLFEFHRHWIREVAAWMPPTKVQ